MFLLFCPIMACNTPEQSPKDQVIIVDKHSAPQKEDFENYSFSCCSDPIVQKTVEAYVELTTALADDNGKRSTSLATTFLEKASTHPSLKEESAMMKPLWTDLEGIRANLSDISLLMIALAKKHKAEDGKKIIAAFCPMAPGRWLQIQPEIHNPYYGAKMLKCGVFE